MTYSRSCVDYSCANYANRRGYLYITQEFLCFGPSIFGKKIEADRSSDLVMPIIEIHAINKVLFYTQSACCVNQRIHSKTKASIMGLPGTHRSLEFRMNDGTVRTCACAR